MMNWPVIIFATACLVVTGTAAWIVKAIVEIGRATRWGGDPE